jgi:peptide/nickel transport system ATP-binding protein
MNTSPAAPLLEVRDLKAGYGKAQVLRGLNFSVRAGEALGLIGASGAGKSTLIFALLGLLSWRGGWSQGQVLLGGQDLLTLPEHTLRSFRGKQIALVPQSPMGALNGALSLRTHFVEAWAAHRSGRQLEQLWTRVRELMAAVQLPVEESFLRRKPAQISVGQAQRITLALALLHRPAVLVADEPTSALDPSSHASIVRLLRTLTRESGTTLVYISHDLLSVLQIAERVGVLQTGSLVEIYPTRELADRATHPATRELLDALPVPPSVLLEYAVGEQPRAAPIPSTVGF